MDENVDNPSVRQATLLMSKISRHVRDDIRSESVDLIYALVIAGVITEEQRPVVERVLRQRWIDKGWITDDEGAVIHSGPTSETTP